MIPEYRLDDLEQARRRLYDILETELTDKLNDHEMTWLLSRISFDVTGPMWALANTKWPAAFD